MRFVVFLLVVAWALAFAGSLFGHLLIPEGAEGRGLLTSPGAIFGLGQLLAWILTFVCLVWRWYSTDPVSRLVLAVPPACIAVAFCIFAVNHLIVG